MTITPNDLFAISRELFDGPDEVHFRGCASRSYYAAFHLARGLFEKIRRGPELRGGVHAVLIEGLKNFHSPLGEDVDRKINQLGFFLSGLRILRVEADYILEADFSKAAAEQALGSAEKIESSIMEIHEIMREKNQ